MGGRYVACEFDGRVNASSLAWPWVQMRKMSSVYLSQTSGLSGKEHRSLLLMAPIKMLVYVGAIHVPMAVL